MNGMSTTDPKELSREKPVLITPGGWYVYRQPGGCLEVHGPDSPFTGHPGWQDPDDMLHFCEQEDWDQVVDAVADVYARVPKAW